MRPPAIPQSATRYPLNAILGTEANVRLVRVLISSGGHPIGTGDLARRAALGRTSVYPALNHLELAGVVGYVGSGRQRHVRFREEHPLASSLRAVFEAEGEAFTKFLGALRNAAGRFTEATAVWLEGPITVEADGLGEPVPCFVLGAPNRLSALTSGLRDAFANIERSCDVTIPVHGITRSELAMRGHEGVSALLDAIQLAGTPPAAFHPRARKRLARPRQIVGHGDHDAHALKTAGRLAGLIAKDPGLVERALREVERRMPMSSPGERRELDEWAHLLRTASPRRLRGLLVHPGERMTRLRQTMPFVNLLAPGNRARASRERVGRADA